MTGTPADEIQPRAAGVRERAKARRRDRILRNALRLFAERGYEATTVADIAEAAELAPRTVTGYFPSKIDIALVVGNQIADGLAEAFRAAQDADLVGALDHWLSHELPAIDRELIRLSLAAFEANPALGAVSAGHVTASAAAGAALIAAQLGIPPEHPAVAICVGAIGNATGAYIAAVAEHGPDEKLHTWFLSLVAAMLRNAPDSDERSREPFSQR